MSGTATAAGTLALVKSLFDLPTTAGIESLSGVVKDTYDWLMREKLSEESFNLTQNLAYDRAFPNEHGNKLYDDIQLADELASKERKSPLNLVRAGSLGRTLAREPRLRYIVTTRAALAHCHSDHYVTELICSLIVDKGGHQDEIQRARSWQINVLRAVMSKMVESITAHVTNPGLGLADLPTALSDLHKHSLLEGTFAAIISGIQRTADSVFIQSDHFLYDLTLWLIYHFDGVVNVSVDGRKVFSQSSGDSTREVFFNCKTCTKSWAECNAASLDKSVKCATVDSQGIHKGFLTSELYRSIPPFNTTRMPLYKQDRILFNYSPSQGELLLRVEWVKISRVAKGMLQWLLSQWVEPYTDAELQLRFVKREDSTLSIQIRDLFQSHPNILNAASGSRVDDSVLFEAPTDSSADEWPGAISDDDDMASETHPGIDTLQPETILSCFPEAGDLSYYARQRCTCSSCTRPADIPLSYAESKFGCVYYLSITALFGLLGHGIADAFGAQDGSGLVDPLHIVQAVTAVFFELIYKNKVNWHSWFAVAACVVTGVDVGLLLPTQALPDAIQTFAAVQYGSLVVSAKWLDLDSVHRLRGCFSLQVNQGTISGVLGDIGVLCCEESDRYNVSDGGEPIRYAFNNADDLYTDELALDRRVAVFNAGLSIYQLLTFIKTENHVTVIDPVEAVRASIRSEILACSCDTRQRLNSNSDSVDIPNGLRISDIEAILEHWSSHDMLSHARMTTILDNKLKINVALSLSRQGKIWVCDIDKVCHSCLVATLRRTARSQAKQGPTVIAYRGKSSARKQVVRANHVW